MDNFLKLLLALILLCESIVLLLDGAELFNSGQPLKLAIYLLVAKTGSKWLDKALKKGAGLS